MSMIYAYARISFEFSAGTGYGKGCFAAKFSVTALARFLFFLIIKWGILCFYLLNRNWIETFFNAVEECSLR